MRHPDTSTTCLGPKSKHSDLKKTFIFYLEALNLSFGPAPSVEPPALLAGHMIQVIRFQLETPAAKVSSRTFRRVWGLEVSA